MSKSTERNRNEQQIVLSLDTSFVLVGVKLKKWIFIGIFALDFQQALTKNCLQINPAISEQNIY